MLLRFAVQNFLSFHHPAILSALAAPDIEHSPGQLLDGPDGLKLLRILAVYGANASGKSNLLKAMAFSQAMITEGVGADDPIPIQPFRFDPEARQAPSRFEWELFAGAQRWSYGFTLSAQHVEAEWLYTRRGDDEELIFEREAPDDPADDPIIALGPALEQVPEHAERFRSIAAITRHNRLLLGELHGRRVAPLEHVAAWFHEDFGAAHLPSLDEEGLARSLMDDPAFHRFTNELMTQADTGIRNLNIRSDFAAPSTPTSGVPPHTGSAARTLRHLVTGVGAGATIAALAGTIAALPFSLPLLAIAGLTAGAVAGAALGASNTTRSLPTSAPPSRRLRLDFTHHTGSPPLASHEESEGTLQLLRLAPILYMLTQPGRGFRVVCIDELERSLHPNLSRFLLETLQALPADQAGQLIVATHDTNLLDRALLPPDAIALTEKDRTGASALYTLAEFKPEQLERQREHLERGYLQGRFGAVPLLGAARQLGWLTRDDQEEVG